MNFQEWYNEADMPTKVKGEWVDLETGLPFADVAEHKKPKPRYTPSSDVKSARAVAKAFGGKALTGTTKQKEWGEKIRAELLSKLGGAEAEILATYNELSTAKVWIENRDRSVAEMEQLAIDLAKVKKALLKALKVAEQAFMESSNRTLPSNHPAIVERDLKQKEFIELIEKSKLAL